MSTIGTKPTGIELISAERRRHPDLGWTAEHDAQHQDSQLAWAACYYTMPCMIARRCSNDAPCPITPDEMFAETGWSPKYANRGEKNRVERLTIAGALIAAEIDRLLAAEES